MSFSCSITFDVIASTATLVFLNPTEIDKVTFNSNNTITFSSEPAFSLSKYDFALYCKFLNSFNLQLFQNFQNLSQFINNLLPICEFDIKRSNNPQIEWDYTQTSSNTTVTKLAYKQSTGLITRSIRPNPIIITPQEYFMKTYLISQFATQVALS